MRLFAGLGNPWCNLRYQPAQCGVHGRRSYCQPVWVFHLEKKGPSLISEGWLVSEKVILIKPQTFMNNSGLPIADIVDFHKIETNNVFVFHDELDLAAGKLRVKVGSGPGGHNNLRDIDRHLGFGLLACAHRHWPPTA